jgi:hypothetical protein
MRHGLPCVVAFALTLPAGGCSSDDDVEFGAAGSAGVAGEPGGAGQAGAGGSGGCALPFAMICEGPEVVRLDPCTGEKTPVRACPGACYLGECVDCTPEAGKVCVGQSSVEVDSCGQSGEATECPVRCSKGVCVGEECTPGAELACRGDALVSLDSCGNVDNLVTTCKGGCESSACTGCTPDAHEVCFDGDVYHLDSCKILGDKTEDCPDACVVTGADAACRGDVTCTAKQTRRCFMGDMHWVDSCGGIQTDLAEDCPSGCDDGGCLPCKPTVVGVTCVGSAVHDLIGGCSGEPSTVGDKREDCAHGCQAGVCLPPICTPDTGRICVGSDVHWADSCGNKGAWIESCPAGCELGVCSPAGPVCGDGKLESPELCDRAIAPGAAGACPSNCEAPDPCVESSLAGSAASCDARCEQTRICKALSVHTSGAAPLEARGIAQALDGSFMVAGKYGVLASIARIDASGKLVWHRSYSPQANAEASAIARLDEQSFVVVGSALGDGWVARIGQDGATLGQRRFASFPLVLEAVSVGASGICAAGRSQGEALVMKLTPNLNLVWAKSVNAASSNPYGYGSRANAVVATPSGGCAVAGRTYTTSDSSWLFELDATGAMLWQKVYSTANGDTASGIALDAGGYVATGTSGLQLWVARLDAGGEPVWQKRIASPGMSSGRAVVTTAEGDVAVLGETSGFGAGVYDAWFLRLSSAGELQHERTYGGSEQEQGTALLAVSSGFVLAGNLRSLSVPNSPQTMLLSVGPEGQLSGTCPSGFSAPSSATVSTPTAGASATNATPSAPTLTTPAASTTAATLATTLTAICG